MNSTWLPGLIVLALGLGCGWLAAWRLRSGSRPSEARIRPAIGRILSSGFLYGFATATMLAGLLFWVARDARPSDDEAMPATAGQGAASPVRATPAANASIREVAGHGDPAALSPAAAARLEPLRARLEADPADLGARKQLAVVLLAEKRLVEAFEEAEAVLRLKPADPDGLYVQGVVRLAMGQGRQAVALLDQVLAQYPEHVAALVARGKAHTKSQNIPMAIASWERGLLAAGGRHAELERLLARARAGDSPAEILQAGGARQAHNGPPSAGIASTTFQLRVELAPGTRIVPQASLFAALRGPDGGPPAAVKRIAAPAFPLDLTLGPDDTMMGQPLPARGTVSVRLDGDGNASTHDAGDLSAQAQVEGGSTTRLVLEG